jgi:phytoene synthase
MSEPAISPHEATVRKADYDRYLAAMVAPKVAQQHLFALYAFNCEVAKIGGSVREPIAGHIRLQWWREAIDEAYAGRACAHPVVASLTELIAVFRPPRELFDQLIDARESDLEETPFADMASLEAYANATSGNVMRLAARILGGNDSLDNAAKGAGVAYALTGLLRSLPYHALRRHLMLPLDILREAEVDPEEIFAGDASERLPRVIKQIADHARESFASAQRPIPRRLVPALLPAALVPIYLRVLVRPGFDPFRDSSDVPTYRRQLAMAGALFRKNL